MFKVLVVGKTKGSVSDEALAKKGTMKKVFAEMEMIAREKGFQMKDGSMIDASVVKVPTQRLNREAKEEIESGRKPKWKVSKRRQKDLDAE